MTDEKPHQAGAGEPRFTANMPQRYLVNQRRYWEGGGLLRLPGDMRGFLSAETNKGDMPRFYAFSLALDQIVKEGIKGDFAELGVYKGHTAYLLASIGRRLGVTTYLLDTFTGFSDADLKGTDAHVGMGFTDNSIEAVRALVGEKNVQFVAGYFPDSAAQIPPETRFSLVHLDCDLYAPMANGLSYFYARLAPGGFLIMHDYSSLHWMGAERAIDEFFASKAEAVVPMPDSAGSVMVRKSRAPSRYGNWYVQRLAALLGTEWASAADGKLAALLGDGWSTPENWGIWGIGELHQFFIFLGAPPTRGVELEFDVAAFLLNVGMSREFGVSVNGRLLEQWTFSPERNHGVRTLRISPDMLPITGSGLPVVRLEFRPTVVISDEELRARGGDQRKFGLALHRVRRARLE